MLLRLHGFRSLFLLYNLRRTSSSSSSSSSLSAIPHVEMIKSKDISKGNGSTVQTRRVKLNVNGILKHLGIQQQPNAPVPAINNTGCSLSVTTKKQSSVMHISKEAEISTSDNSVFCSKATETESPHRDVDHEDKCSSPFVGSDGCSSRDVSLEKNEFLPDTDCTRMLVESSLPTSFGKRKPSQSKKPNLTKRSLKLGGHNIRSKRPNKNYAPVKVFDICQSEAEDFMHPKSPIEFLDEAEETEHKLSEEQEPAERVLRPGMILLKNYISLSEQVSIVNKCRELGIGPGGFYQPGYKDGAKLRLHMMCLGLDWDPQTRKYGKTRRIDKSKPPKIPPEFLRLVDRAMLKSLTVIKKDSNVSNTEDILPLMYPDVCIVNFYSEAGRLGLHQDRDESTESLTRGLPVVSLSLGDSAEFLYGDHRNVNKAEHLVLESGDVLIFGGQSRHVFHGISAIIPNSAPRSLIEETRLCPGRLNLTFRQYEVHNQSFFLG